MGAPVIGLAGERGAVPGGAVGPRGGGALAELDIGERDMRVGREGTAIGAPGAGHVSILGVSVAER
jgi:hypothetical protein